MLPRKIVGQFSSNLKSCFQIRSDAAESEKGEFPLFLQHNSLLISFSSVSAAILLELEAEKPCRVFFFSFFLKIPSSDNSSIRQ